MVQARYTGLAEFGLPLIAPNDDSFDVLLGDIEAHPGPGPALDPVATDRAAVLLNNTDRAIITLAWFWRYTNSAGTARTSWFSNFGSSVQRDVLTGRSKVSRDLGSFILPGSKRLITPRGMFGNNLDVLAPEELPRAQGYCGGWGGGGPRDGDEADLTGVELVLDLVVLEDGRCVGPDESGLYDALIESLDVQRRVAQEAVNALHDGASIGRIFEIVRPVARHDPSRPPGPGNRRPLPLNFGHEAVHRLVNADESELLAFFESAAAPLSLPLRRV